MPETLPSCDRTTDIGAYLLAGMPPEEATSFRMHADGCATCSEEIRGLRPLVDRIAAADLSAFAGSPRLEPSSSLRDRILVQAAVAEAPASAVLDGDRSSAGRSRRTPRRRVALLAAAAAGVFGLGLGSGVGVQMALEDPVAPISPWAAQVYGKGEEIGFVSTQTDATNPLSARAWIESGKAGTYAALFTKGLTVGETYSWWFEKADGSRIKLGSFTFPEGQTDWLVCPGSTSTRREELIFVGATDSKGIDVLRSMLPIIST